MTTDERDITILAIIQGYDELERGDEVDYDRRHLVLRAALLGIDIDPDTLPDTCPARRASLVVMIPTVTGRS